MPRVELSVREIVLNRSSEERLHRVKIRLSRSGFHFAFVSLFTIVGSVVRDLNLLAILAGLFIGTLIVQWRFGRGSLIGLVVEREVPEEVFAGDSISVTYRVANLRRLLPAFFLQIDDPIASTSLRREAASLHAVVDRLTCGEVETASARLRITQRGAYRLGPLAVSTEFPFGLMRALRYGDRKDELVVYPALGRLHKCWRGWLMSEQPGLVDARRRAGINEGDFYGLRGWHNGDSRRWIHWRTTARIGELAVRQFEQQNRQQIGLLVDLYQAETCDVAFERLLSFAATLINEVTRNPENQVGFVLSNGKAFTNLSLRGGMFRRSALQQLAIAKRVDNASLHGALRELACAGNASWPMIVASTRPVDPQAFAERPGDRWRGGQFDVRWLNLSDPSSDQIFVEALDLDDQHPEPEGLHQAPGNPFKTGMTT